jgi:hypothetical protein
MPAKMNSRRRAAKIATLLERHGNRCWLCGKPFAEGVGRLHPKAVTLDHYVPAAFGGVNANENLRLAHRRCNNNRSRDFYDDGLTASAPQHAPGTDAQDAAPASKNRPSSPDPNGASSAAPSSRREP